MSDLVESILSEDYVSASQLFEERLNNIVEKKLYEMKRSIAARQMNEIGSERPTIAQQRASGFQKATDVLGLSDYDKERSNMKSSGQKASIALKGTKAKKLLPSEPVASTAKRTSIGDYVGGSDYEKKAKELKARGSQGAAKWLKKTRTTRNVLRIGKDVAGFGKNILSGLASLYEEENN
jgi:hypothetical protein